MAGKEGERGERLDEQVEFVLTALEGSRDGGDCYAVEQRARALAATARAASSVRAFRGKGAQRTDAELPADREAARAEMERRVAVWRAAAKRKRNPKAADPG